MEFIAPLPFAEAIRKLSDQSVVGSTWSASEWNDLPVELRENAFFSSRIESAQFLQRAQDAIGDFLAGNQTMAANGELMLATGSRAAFVEQMRKFLATEGVTRTTGDIHDITSEKRLGLIFDIKTRQAQDFGYWLQGMNPDLLNAYPAMRFIRVQEVKEPRALHERFQDQVYLKTDPIWWLEINQDFGVPWGPWGWGCGHDVEDVDRDEAEALGLIKPGQKLKVGRLQPFLNFNHNLQASTKNLNDELVQKLLAVFGEKVVLDKTAATLRWRGQPAAQPGDVVTDLDRATLRDYTAPNGTAESINRALWRERAAAPAPVQQAADALTTALAKLPVYEGEVYRGVRRTDAQMQAAAARYLPGNIVTEDAFISGSADRGQAFPGELRFEIVSKAGRRVASFSTVPEEQEIVFAAGTQFKVLSARWTGNTLHVKLEEL